jgi:hypothetical protein
MHPSYQRHLVIGFVVLIAVMACALPAQTIAPTAGIDPNAIETAIAGTLAASARQTQQAALLTEVPLLVTTATLTPVPQISSLGSALVNMADGATQFIDYTAGAQMVIPPGWLVVRVGEQEYYAAWEMQETKHPAFLDIFGSMQTLDPKVFRMTALDIRPDHLSDGHVPQMEVVFGQGETRTLNEIKKDEIEDHLPLTGYKLLSSIFFETSQGMQALNLEIRWKYTGADGAPATGYRRRVIFKVPSGAMALDLLSVLDKKDLLMPEFDQVLNSITFFTP